MLEIDVKKMEEELSALSESADTFKIFAGKAFDDETVLLEGMCSDFTSKLIKVLNNMQDDNAADLVKILESYHASGKTIVKELRENQDKGMADQME